MNWKPIYTMPDELRDGRQVLLWCWYGKRAEVLVYNSQGYWTEHCASARWFTNEFTHYCEITKPEVRDGE
jgi:hypothetical protein